MKTLKFITIYPEVYDNKDLTPNEKIYLSVIQFFTKGKAHGCKLSDQEMSGELSIGINQIRKIKSKLKKLGLISVNNKTIFYKKTLPNSNETLPNSNEILPNSNQTLPNSNEILPNSNEILPNSNQIPCNSDENQQVTESKEKKNKKEIKENKENKEEKQEKEESFLDDWEKQAILKKEEYKKNSYNNSTINNSCTVVDMVMGLPNNKEEIPINDEPENINETDKNSILDTIAKKMVEKISYNIKIQSDELKHECDRQRFLEENKFNELQLKKHIKEYIKDRDLTKIIQDVNVFNRFAINAFNSYKNGIKKAVTKLPKKNPYSDLEDSNSSYNEYKETNRWLNK